MSKNVLVYVITNTGYKDNHIYKCNILIDDNGDFIRQTSNFEAVMNIEMFHVKYIMKN